MNNGTGFPRQLRIGLSLLLLGLTAFEIAMQNRAMPLAIFVISLFILAGLAMFIIPPAK